MSAEADLIVPVDSFALLDVSVSVSYPDGEPAVTLAIGDDRDGTKGAAVTTDRHEAEALAAALTYAARRVANERRAAIGGPL